ncbi:pentapeptide repeat-containing protein [Streptomyces sp. NPDC006372]|uniref:pentapeptide repeat-containing protein n=1 Tax=Streptomyces sp. NPDC006372 TaxID=3155599 RepID=UPI0033A4AF59
MVQIQGRRVLAYGLAGASAALLVVAFSWSRLFSLAARIPVAPLVLTIASAACGATASSLYRRARPPQNRHSVPPIRSWWMALAFVAVLAAVWITTTVLMPQSADTRQRNDVVRTALAAGAGVGAAVTVMLAFRRQQHHETATAQTEYDATERRITELYTKAVEQLGNAQAPVRLGGLYALERLGQAAPDHRQTIVDVICAYLRMPYNLPTDPRPSSEHRLRALSRAEERSRQLLWGKANDRRRQELQVRLTAQSILAAHLRDTRSPEQREDTPPDERLWHGIRIDLTHATLINFDFRQCQIAEGYFTDATFAGDASFESASFRVAEFGRATFEGYALFVDARFTGETAGFGSTTFIHRAEFAGAVFTGTAWFFGANFHHSAGFVEATFTGGAAFTSETCTNDFTLSGARVTSLTPEDGPVPYSWPLGWSVQPTPDGGGTLVEEPQPHGERV